MVTHVRMQIQGSEWPSSDPMRKAALQRADTEELNLLHPDYYVSGDIGLTYFGDSDSYRLNPAGVVAPFNYSITFAIPPEFDTPIGFLISMTHTYQPFVITIFGSEDGVTFTELGSRTLTVAGGDDQLIEFEIGPDLALARLVKNTNTSFVPARPGDPGSPGQPYLPARTVSQPVQVCSWTPLSYAEIQAAYAAAGISITWGVVGQSDGQPIYGTIYKFTQGSASSTNIPSGRYVCRTEYRLVSLPAQAYMPPRAPVPPSPAQLLYDYQLGWNARANSVRSMLASGTYSFRIPADTIGAVVGLSKVPRNSGFSDILWGFYVSRGIVRIYEGGVEVDNLGSFPNARLALTRRSNNIEYYVGSSLVRTAAADADPVLLSASLYSGGDSVDDAALVEFGEGGGAVEFPSMQVYGGDVAYAIGTVVSAPMTVQGRKDPGGAGAMSFLPALVVGSDASGYADGRVVMRAPDVQAEALAPEPSYAIAGLVMMPMVVQASGLTGTIGTGAVAMRPMNMVASEGPYAEGRVTMRAPTVYGENFIGPTEAVMINFVLASGEGSGEHTLFVIMRENVGVVGLISVQELNLAALRENLGVTGSFITQAELQALIASVMSARGFAGDSLTGLSVWAMNMDNNGGTRYDNFNFNSFAKIGDTYYGANADGLFALEGADDDGTEIDAEVNFGKLRFGTSARKSMRYCYVGVASDGRLVLKVEADGETYYYDVRDYDETHEMQRFELGRGLRAVYYDFTLQNSGGSAFDLASIEFTPIPLTRRL